MAVKDKYKQFYQSTQTSVPRQQTNTEIGFTGTKIFAGLPMEEYNPDLEFPASVTVYDEMRRSDSQVTAILNAVRLPIISTKWYIQPDDSDGVNKDQAQEIADFFEDMLFGGMRYSWEDHLREGLLFTVFGFSVFEKVYKMRNYKGRPLVVLDKLAPRVASSIWRFPQDERFDVAAVEQINYMTGQIKSIPIDRCLIYTHDREGSNPVGISMLRPAYRNWYIKDALSKIISVGIEKAMISTPYAQLPASYSQAERDKVLAVLSAIRTAEEAGFTLTDDVKLNVLDSSASGGVQNLAMAFLEYQDTQIAKSVLAQFLQLGTMSSASGGSYALGNTMVDMFVMSLEYLATYIQGEIQKQIIDELTAWNFGPNAPIPKLRHGRISSLFHDVTQVATALGQLGSGHVLTPDEDVENFIRELFGMSPMDRQTIDNQLLFPPNRYVPYTVPDGHLTPAEVTQLQKMRQAGNTGPQQPKQPQQQPQQMTEEQRLAWIEDMIEQAAAAGLSRDDLKKYNSMMFDDPTHPDPFSVASNGEKPAIPGKWRRDLTKYEQTVKWTEIDRKWTTFEERLIAEIQLVMRTGASQYIEQVETILTSHENDHSAALAAIMTLPFPAAVKVTQAIEAQLWDVYQYGQEAVKSELSKPNNQTQIPPADQAAIAAKAQTYANRSTSQLLTWLQQTAISNIQTGVKRAKVIENMQTGANSFVYGANKQGSPQLRGAATVMVGDALNIGRSSSAKQLGIQGAAWSAVLDAKTCEFCADQDGKVISVDNPDFDLFRPPAHAYCRCIWVYILDDEENVEFTWTTPHKSDVDKYAYLIARNL